MPQLRFRRSRPAVSAPAIAVATVICSLLTTAASAQTIFTDNFDIETPGLSQTSLTNWTVTNASDPVSAGGSVDVIGTGSGFDFYPGNGRYLDLDGTTAAAAVLTTRNAFSLAAGSYTLSFDLGKNGADPESMIVSVGSVFTQAISDSLNYPSLVPTTLNFTVSSATTGAITFNHAGKDQKGYIIDNVSLIRQQTSTAAPEPGTLSLLTVLPITFGLLRLRRRK